MVKFPFLFLHVSRVYSFLTADPFRLYIFLNKRASKYIYIKVGDYFLKSPEVDTYRELVNMNHFPFSNNR